MVANCPQNALNALQTRHLADFSHPVERLPYASYVYRMSVRNYLALLVQIHYAEGSWRTGKSLRRQQEIQDSIEMDQPNYSRVKAHIKTEISPQRPKKARAIQAFYKPIDNYMYADWYRAYTHAFLQWTAVPRTFMGMEVHLRSACGLNHAEMAAQLTEWYQGLTPDTRIFIDDVSNMDGSVQCAHLSLQTWLYQGIHEGMAQHHAATVAFDGRFHFPQTVISYTGVATVKSGAQDTSSGQTTRRLDCFVRTARRLGCISVKGFVFGDDVIVFVRGPGTAQDWDNMQAEYGWKCKSCFVPDICQADFLACAFAPNRDGGLNMVPLPGRQLAKLFWTWRDIPPRRRASYVQQVAEGFAHAYEGCVFLEAWLAWHRAAVVDKEYRMEPRITRAQHAAPTCWEEFFFRRYELPMPPMELVELVTSVPRGSVAIINHSWTELVMRYDLADPSDRPAAQLAGNICNQ